MKSISFNKSFLLLIAFMTLPMLGYSQDASGDWMTPELSIYLVIALVFVLAIIILGVSYNVYHIIKTIVAREAERKAIEEGREYVPEPGWWSKLMSSWTRATPIEEEPTITLDHDYDGIRELDNHLPPWWLALLYGSIIFAVIYMLGYHVMGWWPLQEQEYEIAMAKAQEVQDMMAEQEGAIDENAVEYNPDPQFIAGGKAVYDQNCVACHRADGGGLVGPNLTDNYWIHGGTPTEIYKIIKEGVVLKGMAAWDKALTPQKMAQVTSYIISLNGTNPPDAKAAQGELVEPAAEEPTEESAEDQPAEDNQQTEESEGDGSSEEPSE